MRSAAGVPLIPRLERFVKSSEIVLWGYMIEKTHVDRPSIIYL